MKFGPKDGKYDKNGLIEEDDLDFGDDSLSSLLSDEEYYIDENGKRRKRKKKKGDLGDLDD